MISGRRRIARIWGSLYLVIFIQSLLMHLAEKILLLQPLSFGGDYRTNSMKSEKTGSKRQTQNTGCRGIGAHLPCNVQRPAHSDLDRLARLIEEVVPTAVW